MWSLICFGVGMYAGHYLTMRREEVIKTIRQYAPGLLNTLASARKNLSDIVKEANGKK